MRPLVVVLAGKVFKLVLLLQESVCRRLGGRLLKREMHTLMAAVLLRIARLYPFDVDAQAQPPHGEPA
jgi:hypothetical protein